jgi:hypothetical protein
VVIPPLCLEVAFKFSARLPIRRMTRSSGAFFRSEFAVIFNLTTVSPPVVSAAMGPSRATGPVASTDSVSSQATAVPAAVSVTLGQATTSANAQTYSMPGRTAPATVWEQRPDDAISSLMASNVAYRSLGSRFHGLGAAMLERFAAEAVDFSQSATVQKTSVANPGTSASALQTAMQSQLHTDADNQITLSIRTAGGATVELRLGSQNEGLAVQVTVSGGELSETERAALVQLSGAFQEAIDGLGALPPRLALKGLATFDPTVLSSVDFQARVETDDKGTIDAIEFHADARSRSVSATGPSGTVKVDVDFSNPAILGNAAQQAQAMARYLQQFDAAGSRGRGDTALVAMFKDAFTQMNSDYGVTAPVEGRAAPGALALNAGDRSLLSGLADFSASMVQTSESSNPMRPEELDTFSYQVSQSTSVMGRDPSNRSIHQEQQAQLTASYHRPLSPELSLFLTLAQESQFYEYIQLDDEAKVSTDVTYSDGVRIDASIEQSARQSTRVQRYLMGKLESDTTFPSDATRVADVRVLLKTVEQAQRSRDPEDARRRDQALATAGSLAVLPDDPAALRRRVDTTPP